MRPPNRMPSNHVNHTRRHRILKGLRILDLGTGLHIHHYLLHPGIPIHRRHGSEAFPLCLRLRWCLIRRHLHNPQLPDPVLDVVEVAANAELAVPEFFAPAEEVAPGAGGRDAERRELGRGEREERFPGGDLGGVLGELAADEGEEGGGVRAEGRGKWDGASRCSGVETTGTG